jgi:hypothetical protein
VFHFGQAHAAASGVVLDLRAIDPPDVEVA